jgi:hypothetical protein
MGKKPWFGLTGFVLAGLVACGCQDSCKRCNGGWPSRSQTPSSLPPAASGGVSQGAAWNNQPRAGLNRPADPVPADSTARSGSGLGQPTTPGDLTSGSRTPATGLGDPGLSSGTDRRPGAMSPRPNDDLRSPQAPSAPSPVVPTGGVNSPTLGGPQPPQPPVPPPVPPPEPPPTQSKSSYQTDGMPLPPPPPPAPVPNP